MTLNVKIKCSSFLLELVALHPDFSILENYDVPHSTSRSWKCGDDVSYDIQVMFVGKTGYGKSTTLNSLLYDNIFDTDDVESCTRDCQSADFLLSFEDLDHYISLVDMPGIGESITLNKEYHEKYRAMIKKTDLLVYLLRADTRDYAVDLSAFENLIIDQSIRERLIIGLNYVDRIPPLDDLDDFILSDEKKQNLNDKINSIASLFGISKNKIIPYSATEDYNIDVLASAICSGLRSVLRI